MSHLIVTQAARRIDPSVRPEDISILFYRRKLRDDLCPIVAGRRMIPESYLPEIAAALRKAGKLPPVASTDV